MNLQEIEKLLVEATGPSPELDRGLHYMSIERITPSWAGERYTASIDAAISLAERILPGWWWTCGKCNLNAHASVGPDRDGPETHLLTDPTYDNGFDVDDPRGIPALALCQAIVRALIAKDDKR